MTLADLQQFAVRLEELAPASRYRTLSALKSLLAFGHRIGYLPFDAGRVLRLPAVRNRLAERILPEVDLHRILSLEPDPATIAFDRIRAYLGDPPHNDEQLESLSGVGRTSLGTVRKYIRNRGLWPASYELRLFHPA